MSAVQDAVNPIYNSNVSLDGHIIADQERVVAAGPRGRRGTRMQRRPQVAARATAEEDNESNEDDEETSSKTKLDAKVGKKKLEKLVAPSRIFGLIQQCKCTHTHTHIQKHTRVRVMLKVHLILM